MEMNEYRRNLEAIRERFPGRRLLKMKEIREYLGVSDNRVLKDRYGIRKGVTAESLAYRLVWGKAK